MPFNVASIKDKAVSAKNATVTKFQDTRDKHTSTPMARTRFADGGYVPDAKKAPPPPPPPLGRRSFNSPRTSGEGVAPAAPPPPVVRSSKPTLSAGRSQSPSPSPPPPPSSRASVLQRAKVFDVTPAPPSRSPAPAPAPAPKKWAPQPKPVDIDTIDWSNLSPADKQVFFTWLDEFFSHYIAKTRGETEGDMQEKVDVAEHVEPAPAPPTSGGTVITARGPPPTVRSWSKPVVPTSTPPQAAESEFISSYPPPTTHGSQALDLAYYFHPSTHWDTPWYASQGSIPPPLQTNPHRLYKAQMVSRGDMRSISLAALFSDLSAAWVSVSYSGSTNRETERSARYLPTPEPLSVEELEVASGMYGETIAGFAESFLGSGQFCARGECWDLASEALKFVSSSDPSLPAPIPSMGRTHGHLVFVGKASKGGRRQEGRWRGGDGCIRRGDIVEWRSVRIARVGDPKGSYAILGDPEHTAVITRDAHPSSQVYDGASVEPRAIGPLEVVEQSRNNDPPEPVRSVYDLGRFEEGEIWIYRPVSMVRYLGFEELECVVPPMALSI